jgi:mannosyl-3-phosphoglycerate phosphatase family protein
VSRAETGVHYLVFTDLDGSLLDHRSYSYAEALPQLLKLEALRIPILLVSSKTGAEIAQLRQEMGNTHPFIVENGAAVLIPEHYFFTQPPQTRLVDGYWIYDMSEPRARWLKLLASLESEYADEFEYFYQVGPAGIVAMTGLTLEQAERANARQYSEPVRWLGSDERKTQFVDRLLASGASVQTGGRFMAVSGKHDKGSALSWLRAVYRNYSPGVNISDLAIGDSHNDCAMLEVAESALLIRSPVHDFPVLQRSDAGVIHSKEFGPAGWSEGVEKWLCTMRSFNDEKRI